MSLLKKLAGLAVGAAAVGAVAYVLQNREHHDDEYEHIWGPEDEVEPETDSAEPAADDASAEAEPAPAAAPEARCRSKGLRTRVQGADGALGNAGQHLFTA